MTYNFYDTSSLLLRNKNLFDDENEKIIISSITLNELENIKTARNKSEEIKYKARQLTHLLEENPDKYCCYLFHQSMLDHIEDCDITDDMKILACAIDFDKHWHPDETVFITNDLALKNIANILYFGSDSVLSVTEEIDDYSGFKEVYLNEEEMSNFYSNFFNNHFNLYTNEYLIIHNAETGEIVDTLRWNGEEYRTLRFGNFKSVHFGEIKPLKDDIYQAIAADSLINNKITMLRGKAGSGKTLLSLGYLMNRLEQGKIDKIIVFCNTVATVNSAKLGLDG